jgi:dTDP-4-dehydrorhamnose reductase
MRWLHEAWTAARAVRAGGADVRAVTVWALLGSYDWDSLLTRDAGRYEPGAFDVRAPEPRPTALAGMMAELASTGTATHPVLDTPGWWRRPERYGYRRVGRAGDGDGGAAAVPLGRPILVTGAAGTLGSAFVRICRVRGLACVALGRGEMDIADAGSVRAALERFRPWAVVNAAGYVRVDDAEREPERCRRENAGGPAVLAAACARLDAQLLTFSSDLVFDGRKRTPYAEGDAPAPLCVYGCSKAESEARVLETLPSALVVRASAFFGPWDEHNFVTLALRRIADGEAFAAASDAVVSPTYVPDLVHAALDLLIDGERGIWHLANPAALAWADFARLAAARAGLDPDLVRAVPTADLGLAAPRPLQSALGSERGHLLPPLEDALDRYVATRGVPERRLQPA